MHGAANLQGILAAQRAFSGKPSVAVFDTAFHQTMPPKAFLYALPYDLYNERDLQKYGAHGTSVRYLVKEAAQMLGKPADSVNLIVAHIGEPPDSIFHLSWTGALVADLETNVLMAPPVSRRRSQHHCHRER